MNGRRARELRRRSTALAAALPDGPPAAEVADCCLEALGEQWAEEKIVTCPICGRPWTAVVVGDTASWWTPNG